MIHYNDDYDDDYDDNDSEATQRRLFVRRNQIIIGRQLNKQSGQKDNERNENTQQRN